MFNYLSIINIKDCMFLDIMKKGELITLNEIKETMDKKKIFWGFIGIVLLIGLAICFAIALMNHKADSSSSNKTSNSSNSTSSSKTTTVSSNTITSGGTYKITGENTCIVINTDDDVELDLEGATITCDNGPAINIEAGDVNIVLNGDNTITSNTIEDLDGAIYAKDDLTISGLGSIKITSNYDGIVSKDALVINGGSYTIKASDDGIRGKDSVSITDGTFNITAGGDGIKATNDEETDKGYINITGGTFNINSVNDGMQAVTNLYIKDGNFTIKTTGNTSNDSAKGLKADTLITIDGGSFDINTTDDGIHSNGNIVITDGDYTINSKDDAIHADGMLEINDGTFNIIAAEGMEATYVKINDGDINISASDDGINAGRKSNAYAVKIEINGGNITVKMGQGDTDGIDSNGDIIINGGTINVTGQSTFDYDGTGTINGGTVICNGQEVTTLPNQMMGGGQGGQGGNMMPGRR